MTCTAHRCSVQGTICRATGIAPPPPPHSPRTMRMHVRAHDATYNNLKFAAGRTWHHKVGVSAVTLVAVQQLSRVHVGTRLVLTHLVAAKHSEGEVGGCLLAKLPGKYWVDCGAQTGQRNWQQLPCSSTACTEDEDGAWKEQQVRMGASQKGCTALPAAVMAQVSRATGDQSD